MFEHATTQDVVLLATPLMNVLQTVVAPLVFHMPPLRHDVKVLREFSPLVNESSRLPMLDATQHRPLETERL